VVTAPSPGSRIPIDPPLWIAGSIRIGSFDPVAATRAAYRVDVSDAEWLSNLLRAIGPKLDDGLGVSGWFWQFRDEHMRVVRPQYLGCPDSLHEAYSRAAALCSPRELRAFNAHGTCASNSEAAEFLEEAVGPGPVRQATRPLAGVVDQVVLSAYGSDSSGVVLSGPRSEVTAVAPRTRHLYRRLLNHFRAGLQLRSQLSEGFTWDVVFNDRGRLLDATPGGAPAAASELLATAASTLHRDAFCNQSPEQALALWDAVLAGGWAIVAHQDSDGKRLIVARRNRATAPKGHASLSAIEREIVERAASDESFKVIALELGLSQALVSAHFRKAAKKLGVRNRAELIHIVRHRQ
jgi:DNA-binding CsgD family transcriptional regulator